ncbi:DUF1659 domain-containing protein [Bacillus thermotolerans]|uniref:DUF1659 domain-containing protein n=1 Tax=Bacillus thermotolerans TaxID=1221996 RepID=A0A0F5HMK3_BACTR|nr:hypothetical protein [Bacillus thermotolerans]KKB34144.1 hypothetical protein QY95_04030 [Bacillus thermotolerans]KKB34604.1 hypothetical protein QY97_02253 [Bacillus thermotolerans]KKB42093.1 hypothetical protein QY96_01567 [Bacillus thermotolerans]
MAVTKLPNTFSLILNIGRWDADQGKTISKKYTFSNLREEPAIENVYSAGKALERLYEDPAMNIQLATNHDLINS